MRVSRNFKAALQQAAEDACQAGEISRWELARVRLAIAFRPRALAEVQGCVIDEACRAGKMAPQSAEAAEADGFDWAALLEFIKQLLPLILQIISIFSV
jgi:hypothetical protein